MAYTFEELNAEHMRLLRDADVCDAMGDEDEADDCRGRADVIRAAMAANFTPEACSRPSHSEECECKDCRTARGDLRTDKEF